MKRFLVLAYGFYRTRIIKKYFSILAFFLSSLISGYFYVKFGHFSH